MFLTSAVQACAGGDPTRAGLERPEAHSPEGRKRAGDKQGWGLIHGLTCQTESLSPKETRNGIPALQSLEALPQTLHNVPLPKPCPVGEDRLSEEAPRPLALIQQAPGREPMTPETLNSLNKPSPVTAACAVWQSP